MSMFLCTACERSMMLETRNAESAAKVAATITAKRRHGSDGRTFTVRKLASDNRGKRYEAEIGTEEIRETVLVTVEQFE